MIPTETRTARESGITLCIDISLLVNLATQGLMWGRLEDGTFLRLRHMKATPS